jgi:hypothetical protein
MTMDDKSRRTEEVITPEYRWVHAHRELDLETVAEIVSGDYRQTRNDGSIVRRKHQVNALRRVKATQSNRVR